MVSRHSAGHSATTTTTPSSASSSTSTSSIKPTGWIRSTSSASKATPGSVLSDRTNLPSSSSFKGTPLRSLPKPPVHSVGRRTPLANGNAGAKQQQLKLSSFFAPNTAPPTTAAVVPAASKLNGGYHDSPSLARAQRGANGQAASAKQPVALEDDDLEARAASLLRGRFGSVTRSLNASTSSTPRSMSISPPPKSDPQPLRSVPRRAIPQPQPQPQPPPTPVHPRSAAVEMTPPRRQRAEQQQSLPAFEPTLMQQSLSDFTQPAWERARSGKMALFQRLAGVPKHVIMREEKQRMAEELERAHRRMLPRSSPASPKKVGERRGMGSSPRKERLKTGAALGSSPSKNLLGRPPQAVLRSPRTNREIYALETQLSAQPMGGEGGGRSVSLQPMRVDAGTLGDGQRRAVSEARVAPAMLASDELAEEEESETQPLPWAEDDIQPEEDVQEVEETQPLPWDQDEQNEPIHSHMASFLPPQRQQVTEVPTSDDEEMLLLQHPILSSSPSPSPSTSAPASPSRSSRSARADADDAGPSSPLKKRRRVEECSNQSPTSLLRTPLPPRQLPRVSPITLTPNANCTTPLSSSNRFDRVVAALKKEERRQNVGTQLSLNSFIQPSRPSAPVDDEDRRRRGLGVDLEEELSDDNDDEAEGGDITVTRIQQGQEDETQPLPWSSQTQPEPEPPVRPTIDPIQSSPATQRTSTSTTSTASGRSEISLPTESNLLEAGNTQLRDFFDHL
ncbi:uncharacterized protein UTRI_06575 [Ustilago trichophora]|uniref:Uncharacterized protein n=1 Tax=Ustilago trichophora TaxID=86804 RepID=A0A5C3EMX3_9BASI|nr:uncharacterized protein UTRI_06575 [Ustilago trichophora]